MSGRMPWAMVCAAGAGFVSLSYEILWYRIYAFGTGGTLPVFGIFLGVYLAGIAIGAFCAQRLCKEAAERTFRHIARWAGGLAVAAGAVAYLHIPLAVWFAEHHHVMGAMPFAGLAAGLYGAVLPLVAHVAVPPDRRAGQGVSLVYFANIVGSSAGSLLTGFVFLEHLGAVGSSTLLLAIAGCLAVLLLRGGGSGWPGYAAQCLGAATVLLLALAIGRPAHEFLYERLLWRTPEGRHHPFADLIENRSGVLAVTTAGTVFGGGVYDGRLNTSLSNDTNMIYRAYALAGLHPNPRRVLMIGLGSGSWAQVVAHHPRLEQLTVVEINPGYLEVLGRHREVRSLLENPKVNLVIDDGRRWLKARDQIFDVILSNTSFHWRANSTHILSQEFLRLAASRLAADGIVYLNTTFSLAAARTACASFRSGLRFANLVAVGDGLVKFDAERFKTALGTYRIDGLPPFDGGTGAVEPWLAATMPRLLSPNNLETCGDLLLARSETTPMITDDNMASETAVPWNYSFQPPVPE